MSSPRKIVVFAILVVCVVLVLLEAALDHRSPFFLYSPKSRIPDFGQYKQLRTLSYDEFPCDNPSKRVIVVGDIHGMHKSLRALLKRVSYNPQTDVLIHVGDLLAKGPHAGSMATLDFMASNNITGVRGNHDQRVIEWRGWIDWIVSLPGGQTWLDSVNEEAAALLEEGKDVEEWVEKQMDGAKEDKKWWSRIPEDWEIFSDHYNIARDMTPSQYNYLLNLPLKLYVPHAHTHIVHAGLLPSDPRRKFYDSRQPLARIPGSRFKRGEVDEKMVKKLREVQDLAVALHVKQNTVPWVNLNMRGVKGSTVTRDSKKGKPWSKLWERDNSHCVGYNRELASSDAVSNRDLPCYPSSVIYGHAASRGLDVKRWSFGLDSGCVYERKLTALIIDPSSRLSNKLVQDVNEYYDEENVFDIENASEAEGRWNGNNKKNKKNGALIPFGDDGRRARLVKVQCKL